MRIVVTAGPTREYIDSVRFVSNASSGIMGYSVARVASRRGHDVVLISGPVALKPPKGVFVVPVTSAEEMRKETLKWIKRSNALVMTAAVADFRPLRRIKGKMKKEGKKKLTLHLERTPDILGEVARIRSKQLTVIGFALEENTKSLASAEKKMAMKRLDMIVLDGVNAIGSKDGEFVLITPDRHIYRARTSKLNIAEKIVDFIEKKQKENPF
ncbi:MAG: hypothetical protein N2234_02675 [Planctomycetota bacterium]|nr:hypothetical protein [Planctomycetota bacterium]